MLLPILETTDNGFADGDLALKKNHENMEKKHESLERTTHAASISILIQSMIPKGKLCKTRCHYAFSFDSRSNVDPVAKDCPSNGESVKADVRSKLRLTEGSVLGIVKARMYNASIIESDAIDRDIDLFRSSHGKLVLSTRDMSLLSLQKITVEVGK